MQKEVKTTELSIGSRERQCMAVCDDFNSQTAEVSQRRRKLGRSLPHTLRFLIWKIFRDSCYDPWLLRWQCRGTLIKGCFPITSQLVILFSNPKCGHWVSKEK